VSAERVTYLRPDDRGALGRTGSTSGTIESVAGDGSHGGTAALPAGPSESMRLWYGCDVETGVVHWSQDVSGTTSFTDLPTTLANGLATAPVTHFSHGHVAAASQPDTIDVCQQINTMTGDITGCPAGYSCGVGPCFLRLGCRVLRWIHA
jgi:hypothetical protein